MKDYRSMWQKLTDRIIDEMEKSNVKGLRDEEAFKQNVEFNLLYKIGRIMDEIEEESPCNN